MSLMIVQIYPFKLFKELPLLLSIAVTFQVLSPISVQFSCSVMSDSLWHHELQHTRLPCPSPSPGVCSNSCSLSRWCYPTTSSCRPLLLLPSIFSSIRVFSSELTLRIRWRKYWGSSFSINPNNEYSGLISFGIDWFDHLAVQGTLKSLQHHTSKASAFFTVHLSHPYMTTGKTKALIVDLCQQSDVSAFPHAV